MRVLEEHGRLGDVDGDILSKIQLTIKKDNGKSKMHRKGKQSSPRDSVLQLARARQQQLFGIRTQNRSPLLDPRGNTLLSGRNQVVGGECQALKTENSILKQQLLAVQSQQQQLKASGSIKLFSSIQVKTNK